MTSLYANAARQCPRPGSLCGIASRIAIRRHAVADVTAERMDVSSQVPAGAVGLPTCAQLCARSMARW